MRKEKGFTLIELLAVIVILAVIELIATPLIMGTITKAKNNALKDTAYGILKAANNYQAEQIMDTEGEAKPLVIKNLNTDDKLLYKGQKPTCGYLVVGEGIETIVVGNNQAIARKAYDDKDIQVSKGSCKELEKEMNELDKIVTPNLTTYHTYKSAPVLENGKLVWKDQSGNGHDGEMIGFDGNSGYQSDGIHFDGVNDVINLGMKQFDMTKGVTFQLRFKMDSFGKTTSIFGNWEGGGAGIYIMNNGRVYFDLYISSINSYIAIASPDKLKTDTFHTVTATYDNSVVKLYIDGKLCTTRNYTETIATSRVQMALGANPGGGGTDYYEHTNMTVQSAFIYQRGLTEEEVKHNYLADIVNSNS